MNRAAGVFAFLSLACTLSGSASAQNEKTQPMAKRAEATADVGLGRPVMEGQLLVTLHAGINADDLKPIFERFEAKFEVVDRVESLNSYTLATDHERLAELKQRLENHPYVASAAFNSITTLSRAVPFDDPVFKKPSEMPEDKDNWNLYRIKAPEAWEITTGGATAALVDSGAMLDHEDLAGQTKEPYSFATSGPVMQDGIKKILYPPKTFRNEEVRNHGTHVSVTIAGKGGNGVGTVGIAPSSTIIPFQAVYFRQTPGEESGNLHATDADAARAMALAMDRGAAAINMSIGSGKPDLIKAWHDAKTDAEREEIGVKLTADAHEHLKHYAAAFDRANKAGVIVVVAAGNDHIPAEFGGFSLSRRAISVAATTREDQRASFSNYGSYTTVSAPGHEIWSGFAEPGKPYAFLSGTSMACPHGTGVVALMKTVDPGLKLPDVAAILIKTGRTLQTDQPIGPLINARAALDEVNRRKALGIREPELPPLIPPPAVNPKLPDLPKEGTEILRRPAPWDDPNVRRIIRAWLAVAIARPPAGGDARLRWFFNLNGQLVNNRNVLTIRRPVWAQFNYRWLWENALVLDSANAGSLYEFTVGTLRSGKFDPSPTRVPEKFRPRAEDPKPRAGGRKVDPGLAGSKWVGTNGKGEKVEFEFGDKVATLKRAGKETKYVTVLNPYVHPMTLDLFPEGGGEPIRSLLHMSDLEDFLIRTDFNNVRPKSITPDDPSNFKFSHNEPAPVAPAALGFQDGDGKAIDGRFAGATVSDGTAGFAALVGKLAGSADSAGPKSAIELNKLNAEPPFAGSRLVIREFKDGAGPTAFIAKQAQVLTKIEFDNGFGGFKIVSRDVGGDHLTDITEGYATAPKAWAQSSHRTSFVYRDQFLVMFELHEAKRGNAFKAEAKAITENSKKLIDARFPPE